VNGTWLRGSVWDRAAIRWRGSNRPRPEPIDIFHALAKAQKILILPNDRVGGLFLGAPAYKIVRQFYPEAHIQLLVDAKKVSFASQIPFVDGVLTAALEKSLWSSAKKEETRALVREEFDLALCLGPDCSFRLAHLCQESGASLRVGFQRRELESFNIEIARANTTEYEGEQCLQMLRLLGMTGDGEVRWQLIEQKAQQIRARYLDDEKGTGRVVGIDLGSGEGRGLGNRQLDDIVGRVVELGARALLFFTLAERKLVNYLKETYGNRVILFEQADLSSAAALLQGCNALIACNTDLLHLAISLQIPSVSLFDEPPGRWVVLEGKGIRVIETQDLRAVSIGQVVQALEAALAEEKG